MKTWIAILSACFIFSSIASAKKLSAGEIKKGYTQLCVQLPRVAHNQGRDAFCACMAQGYVKKGISAQDLKIIKALYRETNDRNDESVQANLLFNFDFDLAEDCQKHLN